VSEALAPRGERLVLLIAGLDECDARPGSLAGDPLGRSCRTRCHAA
jgi:hypothetical protein